MLPTDMALVKDSSFRSLVEVYAKDESLFFKDFSKAYVKLSELGCTNLSSEVLEFKRL
jgi:catalase (peroxidase I)